MIESIASFLSYPSFEEGRNSIVALQHYVCYALCMTSNGFEIEISITVLYCLGLLCVLVTDVVYSFLESFSALPSGHGFARAWLCPLTLPASFETLVSKLVGCCHQLIGVFVMVFVCLIYTL